MKENSNLTSTLVRICSLILQKDDINYDDYLKSKDIIYNHLHIENLSPRQINEIYKLGFKEFGGQIKYYFGLKLKTLKESQINKVIQNNTRITDEKRIYYKECKFKFSPYNEPNIIGYNLLKDYTFSSPQNKNDGKLYVHRDHMLSISYGYENKIPSEHISHPANCEILLERDNISKSSNSSITYEVLLERIKNWDSEKNSSLQIIEKDPSKEGRSKTHRENLSKSLKGIPRPYRRGIKHQYPKK